MGGAHSAHRCERQPDYPFGVVFAYLPNQITEQRCPALVPQGGVVLEWEPEYAL